MTNINKLRAINSEYNVYEVGFSLDNKPVYHVYKGGFKFGGLFNEVKAYLLSTL